MTFNMGDKVRYHGSKRGEDQKFPDGMRVRYGVYDGDRAIVLEDLEDWPGIYRVWNVAGREVQTWSGTNMLLEAAARRRSHHQVASEVFAAADRQFRERVQEFADAQRRAAHALRAVEEAAAVLSAAHTLDNN
ncbi:hypothetical protein [Xanthomonas translucens]|uniref:hypothetical protein n=1 Tax=Xanthomonas campestris pv. translucens TaxID=343 RepID=UPI00071E9B33|nr:hypothetical protein [Xanthomonas translucens]